MIRACIADLDVLTKQAFALHWPVVALRGSHFTTHFFFNLHHCIPYIVAFCILCCCFAIAQCWNFYPQANWLQLPMSFKPLPKTLFIPNIRFPQKLRHIIHSQAEHPTINFALHFKFDMFFFFQIKKKISLTK